MRWYLKKEWKKQKALIMYVINLSFTFILSTHIKLVLFDILLINWFTNRQFVYDMILYAYHKKKQISLVNCKFYSRKNLRSTKRNIITKSKKKTSLLHNNFGVTNIKLLSLIAYFFYIFLL